MYLVFDTNVIFDNWFVESGQFELLARYCKNTESVLLIPRVVVEEVDAKFVAKRLEAIKALEVATRKLQKFKASAAVGSMGDYEEPYSFEDIARQVFPKVEVVEYREVEHVRLVKKAIGNHLPFRESEKGYRDCLMWLSLLQWMGHLPGDAEVAFITRNKSDFAGKTEKGSGNGRVELAADLLADIKEHDIKCSIALYGEIREFTTEHVDETFHSIDREQLLNSVSAELDHALAHAAIEHLERMPLRELSQMLVHSGLPKEAAAGLTGVIEWADFEGVEDRSAVAWRKLDEHRVYIDFKFDMRWLLLRIEGIFAEMAGFMFSGRDTLHRFFYAVEQDGEMIRMDVDMRGDFLCSTTLNIETKTIERVEIQVANVRIN